jgi:fucose 4-O-acetylase-like acetyltransferase
MLDFVYQITKNYHFDYLNRNNFLFYHLGNALIVLGILAIISNFIKIPALLSSIGKSTMMIYVIHIFIIYGTGINNGLIYYYGHSLNPVQVIISAVVMEIFFIFLVFYWAKLEVILQDKYPKIFPKKKVI